MHTIEQPEQNVDDPIEETPKISGFDAGHRSILKEPTLYLSILGLFIVSSLTLLNTPTLFWTVFISLSAVSVIFHILAERAIFSSKKENQKFSAPYEGLFVVTFGSILPGLSLFAYSLFTLLNEHHVNYFLELGKIALLLVVPFFNFLVWSVLRRRYLSRPRLIGMVNGFSLGLSLSWTAIWMKTCIFSTALASCKFGWMFLLCVSPFLLAAAAMLEYDLCKKTEPRIARICGTFSIIGLFLSLLFVFTPTIHTLVLQFALQDARKAKSQTELDKCVSYIQSISSQEDLRPSEYPLSGFALGGLLIPDRGLESGNQQDKDLYFRITGAPYHEVGQMPYDPKTWKPEEEKNISAVIGPKIPGLFLAKSSINGTMDRRTMSGSLDWTFVFHNANNTESAPCAEVALPPGAVVSRATLWVCKKPYDGVVLPTHVDNPMHHTPVLVSSAASDKVLIRCIGVPENGGERKLRVSFKMPLSLHNGRCSMVLPKITEANFGQPKRTHVSFSSKDKFVVAGASAMLSHSSDTFLLEDTLKNLNPDEPPGYRISVNGDGLPAEFAVQDVWQDGKPYIIQKFEEQRSYGPAHLAIVLDTSAQMKPYLPELTKMLSAIPEKLSPVIYLANSCDAEQSPVPRSIKTTELGLLSFASGQDNSIALKEALEASAEKAGGAVLWIHGPQPLAKEQIESTPLDLGHQVRLFDFEVQSGPNAIIKLLGLNAGQNGCVYKAVPRIGPLADDMAKLFASWNETSTSSHLCRSISVKRPACQIISDSALADQVTRLWAKSEVSRLLEGGQTKEAEALAVKKQIVTPVSEIAAGLDLARVLDPSMIVDAHSQSVTYIGNTEIRTKAPDLPVTVSGQHSEPDAKKVENYLGAPVDPRYGQSNEVGSLADYGYDTARDVSRVLTALSLLISLPFSLRLMFRGTDGRKPGLGFVKGLALAFAVPTTVHLLGTFMINNFGGLGGGL